MRKVFSSLFPLLSCQLLSIYICHQNYAIIIRENSPDFLYFETLSLLYINLVICAFVETLNRSFEREQESELVRQQLETQKNYYLDILERQEETRSLWHDIKKYMTTMETLVANEDRDAAKSLSYAAAISLFLIYRIPLIQATN